VDHRETLNIKFLSAIEYDDIFDLFDESTIEGCFQESRSKSRLDFPRVATGKIPQTVRDYVSQINKYNITQPLSNPLDHFSCNLGL